LAVTLCVVGALAAGCGGSDSDRPASNAPESGARARFSVTVRAANGAVTVRRAPRPVVSLSPTATETLFAVGAGEQVVAVDD